MPYSVPMRLVFTTVYQRKVRKLLSKTERAAAEVTMTENNSTALGQELIEAMQEAVAHASGALELPSRTVQVPESVDVAGIRKRLDLSQQEFADRFGFSVSAVRDWEQGRRRPERAARLFLKVIEMERPAVERVLAAL